MTPQETGLVLCYKRTVTCAQHRNLLLDVLDIVVTGLKVDLVGCQLAMLWMRLGPLHTCLMATTSPDAISIALYTTPKLPPIIFSIKFVHLALEIELTDFQALRALDIGLPSYSHSWRNQEVYSCELHFCLRVENGRFRSRNSPSAWFRVDRQKMTIGVYLQTLSAQQQLLGPNCRSTYFTSK